MLSLTDSSGKNVMASYDLVNPKKNYAVLATGTAIQKYTKNKKHIYIELKPGEKNKHTLEYTLRERKTEKETAELKLTKAVTYKKTPIRVNGTYYFGIFQDAAHKKILYKKAMPLSNASSMTSTLKINLYKLAAPHTITLYFAETDKNGKVVSSGKKSGYDISLNKRIGDAVAEECGREHRPDKQCQRRQCRCGEPDESEQRIRGRRQRACGSAGTLERGSDCKQADW